MTTHISGTIFDKPVQNTLKNDHWIYELGTNAYGDNIVVEISDSKNNALWSVQGAAKIEINHTLLIYQESGNLLEGDRLTIRNPVNDNNCLHAEFYPSQRREAR